MAERLFGALTRAGTQFSRVADKGAAPLYVGAVAAGGFATLASKDNDDDLCNPPESNKWEDGIRGCASGMLSILGLGSLFDPIAPLQNKLSTAQANLTDVYYTKGMDFAENQDKINEVLEEVMNAKGEVLQETIAIITEITNENLGRVNVELASMGILLLIVVFYLIFS